jgi:GNAT superfamily N-acetyltransferase
MTAVIVREAQVADAPRVSEVLRAAGDSLRAVYRPNSERLLARGNPYRDSTVLVALVESTITGTLTYSLEDTRLHLRRLAVHPDYQRRGIAKALIDSAADRAVTAGALYLSLDTIKQTGNVAIFERLGFAIVDERRTDLFESCDSGELLDVRMERRVR